VRSVGGRARLLSVKPLTGGQSHANHALRVLDETGRVREVVLRRWVRPDWRETDPQFSPEQEAATYDLLASSGVPAPRLVAADPTGRESDVPAILLTRSPGERPSRPADMGSFVRQLAQALPAIHGIDPDRARRTVPSYRPYYERAELRPPAWTRTPVLWERAIEVATQEAPVGAACFIHRDYHPGNTLWISDQLTAIVDWTTASFGSPSVDVSHMRANLAMSFDSQTADAFLLAHRAIVGSSTDWHPYWDLRVAVDFLPDLERVTPKAPSLVRLEGFVEAALAAIT
jgi:aminoglycoside phosphotransferase (APT) family kinase protein